MCYPLAGPDGKSYGSLTMHQCIGRPVLRQQVTLALPERLASARALVFFLVLAACSAQGGREIPIDSGADWFSTGIAGLMDALG